MGLKFATTILSLILLLVDRVVGVSFRWAADAADGDIGSNSNLSSEPKLHVLSSEVALTENVAHTWIQLLASTQQRTRGTGTHVLLILIALVGLVMVGVLWQNDWNPTAARDDGQNKLRSGAHSAAALVERGAQEAERRTRPKASAGSALSLQASAVQDSMPTNPPTMPMAPEAPPSQTVPFVGTPAYPGAASMPGTNQTVLGSSASHPSRRMKGAPCC